MIKLLLFLLFRMISFNLKQTLIRYFVFCPVDVVTLKSLTFMCGELLTLFYFRLKQRWVEVSVDTQVDELIKAVNGGSRSNSADLGRTIVFANTVEAVEAVAKILLRAGIECYRYHKDFSLEERAKTLDDFQEKGGVLVCTDAAARGVDISNILHVIQVSLICVK